MRPDAYSTVQRSVCLVGAGCASTFEALLGVGVATAPAGQLHHPILLSVGLLGLAVLQVIAVFWRVGRAGVWIETDGVRVVNPTKSTFIAWSDIERFVLKPLPSWSNRGAVAELRDGGEVSIWGIQEPRARWLAKIDRTQGLIDQLNREVTARQQPTGSADMPNPGLHAGSTP
jgi:hypothetical protein